MKAENGSCRGGFSFVELISVLAVVVSVGAVLGPSVGKMRGQMRGVSSEGNLATIGQVGAMYSLDHEDRIFSFTWQGGESYVLLHSGVEKTMPDDQHAAARQLQNILQRATGRISGVGKISFPAQRVPNRGYSHLVLADYMGGNVSDPMWADPADANLLSWQLDPLEYLEEENTVPYGNGQPDLAGYEDAGSWGIFNIMQLWAFSSSYEVVPHAWQQDFSPAYVPTAESSHLYNNINQNHFELGERRHAEVVFPSAKVWMYEEFDREQSGDPYFAYDHAAPAKLMFDGAINTAMSGVARSSVSPADYLNGDRIVWEQAYIPLDTFPVPLGGLGDETLLNMRYRWTLGGLTGADYPQVLMRGR
ncbi:MAG: type II secretion system protein [Phycisphaerales bacterium]